MRLPTAVVVPFARPIPPSVKVMPHDTGGDGARNLLALRFAPRSSWFERSRLRPLALVLLVVRDARAAAAARSGAAGGARRSRGCGRSLWCCWRCATLARVLGCVATLPRRRSAAKSERPMPESRVVPCGTIPLRSRGSGGRERAQRVQPAKQVLDSRTPPSRPSRAEPKSSWKCADAREVPRVEVYTSRCTVQEHHLWRRRSNGDRRQRRRRRRPRPRPLLGAASPPRSVRSQSSQSAHRATRSRPAPAPFRSRRCARRSEPRSTACGGTGATR